jgi:hypothetical protein
MILTLLLPLILSGIQANYNNNTSVLGNGTRIHNISTVLPEVSTSYPATHTTATQY